MIDKEGSESNSDRESKKVETHWYDALEAVTIEIKIDRNSSVLSENCSKENEEKVRT